MIAIVRVDHTDLVLNENELTSFVNAQFDAELYSRKKAYRESAELYKFRVVLCAYIFGVFVGVLG